MFCGVRLAPVPVPSTLGCAAAAAARACRYADVVVHRQLLAALAMSPTNREGEGGEAGVRQVRACARPEAPPEGRRSPTAELLLRPGHFVRARASPARLHGEEQVQVGAVARWCVGVRRCAGCALQGGGAGGGGVSTHAQLSAAARRMNEQHRAAKRAQQLCTELFLLLLLHRKPHVESALVVGVRVRAVLRLSGDMARGKRVVVVGVRVRAILGRPGGIARGKRVAVVGVRVRAFPGRRGGRRTLRCNRALTVGPCAPGPDGVPSRRMSALALRRSQHARLRPARTAPAGGRRGGRVRAVVPAACAPLRGGRQGAGALAAGRRRPPGRTGKPAPNRAPPHPQLTTRERFVGERALRGRRFFSPLRRSVAGSVVQEAGAPGGGAALALQARRALAYECSPDGQTLTVLDRSSPSSASASARAGGGGRELWRAALWGRAWVVLGADGSSAHGPKMSVRAVADSHAAVRGRAHAAAGAVAGGDEASGGPLEGARGPGGRPAAGARGAVDGLDAKAVQAAASRGRGTGLGGVASAVEAAADVGPAAAAAAASSVDGAAGEEEGVDRAVLETSALLESLLTLGGERGDAEGEGGVVGRGAAPDASSTAARRQLMRRIARLEAKLAAGAYAWRKGAAGLGAPGVPNASPLRAWAHTAVL